MTISGLRVWRLFAAPLVLAVLLFTAVVAGVQPQPAQAAVNTYGWPYDPMRYPAAHRQPWQCGLASWMPGYGKCRTWSTYLDGFYDIRYGGPNAQKAVTALLATSGMGDAASRAGHLAAGTSPCGFWLRATSLRFLNDIDNRDLTVEMVKRFFRGGGVYGRMYWPTAKATMAAAVSIARSHFIKMQANAILFAAQSSGCGVY